MAKTSRRRRRREFEAVAREAISLVPISQLNGEKARSIIDALRRPRLREQIRSAFVGEVSKERLSAAELAGKIDFDSLIDLLVEFFPKLATAKKFSGLFKQIVGAIL